MSESRQTREMTRAAREFTEAARELTAAVEKFVRYVERLRPPEPLTEEELAELVDREVHAVREELYKDRKPERGPLTPEEAEEWKRGTTHRPLRVPRAQ